MDNLASRGEFYTSYTPYQAEASQGTLQATFEYQTLVCQLTGMDVSNASLYDGGSAVAEAVFMALAVTRRQGRVVVAGSVHPESRQVLATYLANLEPEVVVVPARGGRVDRDELAAAVTDDTAAVVVQYPNFFGQLEEVDALVDAAKAQGGDGDRQRRPDQPGGPRAARAITAPTSWSAEGQGLGNPMAYGGPYLGILACREEFVRKMPGRVVGQTVDRHGKRVLGPHLADPRAAHPPREGDVEHLHQPGAARPRAASIYLAAVGPTGLRQVAETARPARRSTRPSGWPRSRALARLRGPLLQGVRGPLRTEPARVLAEVGRLGFHGGVALARWFPDLADVILIAVTEKRTDDEIDGLARAYTRAIAAS